jgi:hypothetical protein
MIGADTLERIRQIPQVQKNLSFFCTNSMMIHRIYLRAAGFWSQTNDHYWHMIPDGEVLNI